jgi:cell division protein FtsB
LETLILGLVLLILGLAIVAAIIDQVQINLQRQIDHINKENKYLRNRVFDLEMRRFK